MSWVYWFLWIQQYHKSPGLISSWEAFTHYLSVWSCLFSASCSLVTSSPSIHMGTHRDHSHKLMQKWLLGFGKESKDQKMLVPPVPPSLKTPLRSRARHSQLEEEFQLTQPGWVPSSGSQATAVTKLWGQSRPPWARWGLSARLHLSDSKAEIAGHGKTLGWSASSLQCMGNLSHKMLLWCLVWF